MENSLIDIFKNNTENLINKWPHYFEIYERHLACYRGSKVNILEIGIYQGGSIRMWQSYFGDQLNYYGIDINPLCKQFETKNAKIFIGSQDDDAFLDHVFDNIPELDIVIDDGGHEMNQQRKSFLKLYDKIKPSGFYICEDLHTSYWPQYGGGFKRKGTFIEYAKTLVDSIHAWYSKDQKNLTVDNFTTSIFGIYFYDSILVVEKKIKTKPYSETTGKYLIGLEHFAYDNREYKEPGIKETIFGFFDRYFKR